MDLVCKRFHFSKFDLIFSSKFPIIEAASNPAFIDPLIAIVATGQPRGICTIDNKLSKPLSFFVSIGTPITGKEDKDATMPGKWAEPPAPATITPKPFLRLTLQIQTFFLVFCAHLLLKFDI